MVEMQAGLATDALPSIPGYELFDKIGEGGRGEVHRARQISLHRTVAIKFLTALGGDAQALTAFEREARLMAALAHPHVVTIYDCGQAGGRPYLVMEYIDAPPLRFRMQPGTPMPMEQAGPILDAVAQALTYIHEQGILHLDLKPENVLCTATGDIKITDFGLAAPHWSSCSRPVRERCEGTLDYSAPEQRYGLPLDRRSDVFGLATLAYELLTGRLPGRVFIPATESNAQLPAAVDEVLRRGLARDPDERYATVEEFQQGLNRAWGPLLGRRSGLRTSRAPWLLTAAVVIATLLLIFFRSGGAPESNDDSLPPPFAVLAAAPFLGPDELLYPSNRSFNTNIFLLFPDGSPPVNLTRNEHRNVFPACSPEGNQIAFTSDWTGERDIFVMNAQGRRLKQLTTDSKANRAPSWSPDGRRIVYASMRDGNSEIYVMDADGSNQVNLSNNPGFDADPAWSPDGKTIAYATEHVGEDCFRLMLMDADGSNVRDLSGPKKNTYGYVYPAWSPDSCWLAYGDLVDSGVEVFICRPDGSERRQLTRLGGTNGLPAWSPDGKRIAFQHTDPGLERGSLYIMDADGSNVKLVLETAGPSEGGRPAWRRR